MLTEGGVSFGRADLVLCMAVGCWLLLLAAYQNNSQMLAKLGLAQVSILVVMIPTELALRSRLVPPPAPWYPNTVRDITLTTDLPGVSSHGIFSTNSLGLRGDSFSIEDLNETRFSILCIGGSTTECFYNSDEVAWPLQLQRKLEKKTGEKVYVGNAGRGGHIAKHHAYQLKNYKYAPKFRIVLVLCGWNDLSAAIYGDGNSDHRDIPNEALTGVVKFSHQDNPHQAFYRNYSVFRLAESAFLDRRVDPLRNIGWRAVGQDAYGEWIAERRRLRAKWLMENPRTDTPATFLASLKAYRADLNSIVEARDESQMLFFMTQPTLCRENLPESLEARQWSCDGKQAWTSEATARLLSEFNKEMLDFCLKNNLPCIDLADKLSGRDDVFYDECHFSDVGCGLVADQIEEYICRSLNILQPLEF